MTTLNDDIIAYVDGAFDGDPRTRARIEAVIAASPELQAQVQALRNQNKELQNFYAHRLYEAVPNYLAPIPDERDKRLSFSPGLSAAAAVVISIIAGVVGWQAGRKTVSDHVDGIPGLSAAIHETVTGELMSNVVVDPSLSTGSVVPDLTPLGYHLVSAHKPVLAGYEDGVNVEAVYESPEGEKVGIFLTTSANAPVLQSDAVAGSASDNLSFVYWRANGMSAIVASDGSTDKVMQIAQSLQNFLPVEDMPDAKPSAQETRDILLEAETPVMGRDVIIIDSQPELSQTPTQQPIGHDDIVN